MRTNLTYLLWVVAVLGGCAGVFTFYKAQAVRVAEDNWDWVFGVVLVLIAFAVWLIILGIRSFF